MLGGLRARPQRRYRLPQITNTQPENSTSHKPDNITQIYSRRFLATSHPRILASSLLIILADPFLMPFPAQWSEWLWFAHSSRWSINVIVVRAKVMSVWQGWGKSDDRDALCTDKALHCMMPSLSSHRCAFIQSNTLQITWSSDTVGYAFLEQDCVSHVGVSTSKLCLTMAGCLLSYRMLNGTASV